MPYFCGKLMNLLILILKNIQQEINDQLNIQKNLIFSNLFINVFFFIRKLKEGLSFQLLLFYSSGIIFFSFNV